MERRGTAVRRAPVLSSVSTMYARREVVKVWRNAVRSIDGSMTMDAKIYQTRRQWLTGGENRPAAHQSQKMSR